MKDMFLIFGNTTVFTFLFNFATYKFCINGLVQKDNLS